MDTTIRKRITPTFGSLHGLMASRKGAKTSPVFEFRHPRASFPVNFMVIVLLRIVVDVVFGQSRFRVGMFGHGLLLIACTFGDRLTRHGSAV